MSSTLWHRGLTPRFPITRDHWPISSYSTICKIGWVHFAYGSFYEKNKWKCLSLYIQRKYINLKKSMSSSITLILYDLFSILQSPSHRHNIRSLLLTFYFHGKSWAQDFNAIISDRLQWRPAFLHTQGWNNHIPYAFHW